MEYLLIVIALAIMGGAAHIFGHNHSRYRRYVYGVLGVFPGFVGVVWLFFGPAVAIGVAALYLAAFLTFALGAWGANSIMTLLGWHRPPLRRYKVYPHNLGIHVSRRYLTTTPAYAALMYAQRGPADQRLEASTLAVVCLDEDLPPWLYRILWDGRRYVAEPLQLQQ